jgi:hypothetical protein
MGWKRGIPHQEGRQLPQVEELAVIDLVFQLPASELQVPLGEDPAVIPPQLECPE